MMGAPCGGPYSGASNLSAAPAPAESLKTRMNVNDRAEVTPCPGSSLKIQPILDASGAICEMALAGDWMSRLPMEASHAAAASALRAAGDILQESGSLALLSMDHPLNVYTGRSLAEQLCLDLRIAQVGGNLLSDERLVRERPQPIYPSARVVFNVPLSSRIAEGAEFFRRYGDFKATLRVRLLPCSRHGAPTPFGVLRAVGLRVDIPAGISQANAWQEQFFSLLGHASRRGVKVLACRIRTIEDFNWLRLQPDLRFQGDVLSTALSLCYVRHWLSGPGTDWRAFRMGEKVDPARSASDQAPHGG
ncbi:hypothetical protein [Achromobacter aegrifaciens]|uniref:Uncharacterized protein n=1 Tax=Achromobacter aegrifaciens TaxID=1287736 RepID=A0ABU2DKG6_ACHAE|nr:hypothetical protein [Achromobacter aegrifaciens]MDR7948517.1 hypothetical protein [Achromobacter aegrifaciens]